MTREKSTMGYPSKADRQAHRNALAEPQPTRDLHHSVELRVDDILGPPATLAELEALEEKELGRENVRRPPDGELPLECPGHEFVVEHGNHWCVHCGIPAPSAKG